MIEKVLTKDLLAKSAALILALIVWVQVFNDKNPLERKVLSLDVELKDYSDDKVIMSVNPQKVNVTMEGRARTLAEIDRDELRAVADLSEVGVGSSTVPLNIEPPHGVKVIDISPRNITVDLDVLHSKTVAVVVEAQGYPNEDFRKGAPSIVPESVEVKGPKRLVDKVQWVQGSVDITGAMKPVTSSVKISPKDSQGNEVRGVTVEPERVQVTVPMIALPPSKEVPVQAIITGSPKAGYTVGKVTVNPENVKFRADPEVSSGIERLATKPIDVTGKDSTFVHMATLDLPKGVSVQNSQVSVRVEIVEDIIEKTFTGIPVQLDSPAPGLTWDMDPSVVDIVLTGRSDILGKIKTGDVEAYIDARGRGEGEWDLWVAAKVKGSGSESVQIDIKPPRVKLILTKR